MTKTPIVLSLVICMLLSFGITQAQTDTIEFPELTGSYQVGRANYDMVDDSRQEIYTEDENDIREFTIIVFYPAVPTQNAESATYVEEELIPATVEYTEIPAFVWEGLQPHSYANAPIVDSQFPIILFSHGSGIPITAYTGQMEDLASHGYIVVGISHTYDAPAVMFSDGRILTIDDGTLISQEDALISEEEALAFFNNSLSVWVADTLFTLNELERMNVTDNLLANHMDLSRVGAIGHSFGGATAFAAALEDERILAVIDMDGSLYGNVLEYGLDRPAMTMAQDVSILTLEGATPEMVDEMTASYRSERATALRNSTPGYDIVLPGSSHGTYVTDTLIIVEAFPIFAVPELIGTIEDFESARLNIHNTVLAFFNTYVAESNTPQMSDLIFDGFDITIFNED